MKFLGKYKFIIVIFFILSNVSYVHSEKNDLSVALVKTDPKSSRHGLHFQPNGPFAAMLFNDDAAGINLGIILYKANAGQLWGLDNRFWQETEWAINITSFAWGPNGRFMYVSTSSIYGTGYLYELNLIDKSYKRIYPIEEFKSKSGIITEIVNINRDYIEFTVKYYDQLKKQSVSNLIKYEIPK